MKKILFIIPVALYIIAVLFIGAVRDTTSQVDPDKNGRAVATPDGATHCRDSLSSFIYPPYSVSLTRWWCWAACGEMCMKCVAPNTQLCQCDEAKAYLHLTGACCINNRAYCNGFLNWGVMPDSCYQSGWPPFRAFGFEAQETHFTPLSFDEIKHQISCLRKPVLFSWYFGARPTQTTGGGHMMVIRGYQVINNQKWLFVYDPAATCTIISYDEYVSGNGYSHWNDYFNISKLISSL